MSKIADLRGLWATTVTPFAADGRVDLDGVRAHVSFLAAQGVERFVPGGNTGEFSSLTSDEVLAVTRATREAAPDAVVVTGVGGALPSALELTAEALAAGADAVMVHHPAHTHVSERGVEEYYRAIAGAADGRVLAYKRTHRLPDSVVISLARDGFIQGVKYAVNDLLAFQRAREAAPSVAWICGTAELWAPFFHQLGAEGYTSGLVNAAPELAVSMEAALREGDITRALEVRELAHAFEELRAEDDSAKNVPAVRSAMTLAGFTPGPPRPPLSPLDETDERRVLACWDAWTARGVAQVAQPVAS